MVAMGVIGVAGSEGELAEEVVRLRGRVSVQFGAWRRHTLKSGATCNLATKATT